MIDKKKQLIILYILTIIGSILYISLIFNNNLWMDEAFSAVLINTDFISMMKNSANDTLPPLYNILNWTFTHIFGYSSPILRLSSIIPMICVLFLSPVILFKRWGYKTSLIFTICISGMPLMLNYGVEIRMYALSLFFVTLSGIIAFECFYTPNFLNYSILTVSIIGSAYTHHFAFVSSGIVWFLLFLANFISQRKYVRFSLLSLFATFACYIPCALTTLTQMNKVNNYFSMPEISINLFIDCIKSPFITNITVLSLLLFVLFFAVPVLLIIKTKSITCIIPGICCYLVFILTLSFGFIVTVLFKANIFTPRYLFPSFGLLWLGFAICFSKLEISRYTYTFVVLILFSVLVTTYRNQFILEYEPNVNAMTEFFYNNVDLAKDNYIIFEDNYQIEICFRYYFPGFTPVSLENASTCTGNLWYIEVPGFEEKSGTITSAGYQKDMAGSFNFDRYTFNLYRLYKN